MVEEPSTDPASVAPSIEPAASQSNWKGALREIAETIILTLVIFLLIRTVVQNFRVEGMSMEPNFHDGQFLLINKLAYKLGDLERISATLSLLRIGSAVVATFECIAWSLYLQFYPYKLLGME